MKKLFVLAMIAMFLMITGCTKKNSDSGEITISVVNFQSEEVFNGKIKFEKEDTLLKLLQEHEQIALKGEESDYGFYIKEVAGINASDYPNTYWSIEINGEYSLYGVSQIKLVDKDKIKLILIGY